MANKYFLLPIIALTLASCSQTDEPGQLSDPREAAFSAQIGGTTSRAAGTQWAAGDAIGISGASGSKTYTNMKFVTASGDGNFAAVNEAIYYQTTDEVTFTAYYPYAADSGVITASTADQSQQPAFDFLWAQASGSYASPSVNFNFAHKMSRLTLTFINGNDVNLEGMTYTVDGLVVDGSFDTTTGEAKISDEATTATLSAPVNADSKSSLIVFPQTADNIKVTATIDGQQYVCSLSPGILAAGSSYNISITVKKNEMTVTGSTITDWTDGGSFSGEATIPIAHIGDYFYSDGTYSSEYNANKNVIGIIFYVGHHPKDGSDYSASGIGEKECHGYVMALSAAYSWPLSWLNIENTPVEIEGISFDTDDWNGYANQRAIVHYAENNQGGIKFSDFEPAYMCSIYGTTQSAEHSQFNAPDKSSGWFLPSLGQFIGFHAANCANSNLLNNKIDAVKSVSNRVSNLTYVASWCSTMKSNISAYRVFFPNADNGNLDDIAIFKIHSTTYVRPMLAF